MTDIAASMYMTTALSHQLEERPSRPTALTPDLTESSRDLWTNSNGTRVGFWDCQPGAFRHQCEGFTEICQILTGIAVVDQDNGETVTLHTGDTLVMPSGWRGTWTVEQYVRKLFIVVADHS
ncbi:cupin domain-containing protein [Mycolicibacterium frederiksbergense]|uniref:cupin domain-containing protein n=1 Tax=Mycolicibacterium frederiksbergense TaxID=117567 RepID=UPI003999EBC3